MLESFVRVSVLGLLEHGPLTTSELVAFDAQLNPNSLRHMFLRWLRQGYISREIEKVSRNPVYRYAITERGRAVLASERFDAAAVTTQKAWTRRELLLGGHTYSIEQAAKLHGLKPKTVRQRLARGATPEEAVRPQLEARRVDINGEWVTLLEAAHSLGLTYDSVRRRLAEGRPPEQVTGGAYFRTKSSRSAIRELLANSLRPLTTREIAEALSAHRDTTRGNLDRMLAAGELQRERGAELGAPWHYRMAR